MALTKTQQKALIDEIDAILADTKENAAKRLALALNYGVLVEASEEDLHLIVFALIKSLDAVKYSRWAIRDFRDELKTIWMGKLKFTVVRVFWNGREEETEFSWETRESAERMATDYNAGLARVFSNVYRYVVREVSNETE